MGAGAKDIEAGCNPLGAPESLRRDAPRKPAPPALCPTALALFDVAGGNLVLVRGERRQHFFLLGLRDLEVV